MKKSTLIIAIFLLLSYGKLFSAEPPVNVIFILPDGLSPSVWPAVRAASVGIEGKTFLDEMEYSAPYSTYSADSWITDSAAGISALMTGQKANRGTICQDKTAVHKKSDGKNLQSLMEYAASKGYATGLVTTTDIYDASPAGCYAHANDRTDYEAIAAQLIGGKFTPDIIIGGGRKWMRPKSVQDIESGENCSREDGRDLTMELKKKGYLYVESLAEFNAWNIDKQKKLLALFGYEDMEMELKRSRDILGEPGLWEITAKSIEALDSSGEPFFLFIEAARIDHFAHYNDPTPLIYECIAYDKALGAALDYLKTHPNTLVITAADHACGTPAAIGLNMEDGNVSEKGNFSVVDSDGDRFPDDPKMVEKIAFGWASSPFFYKTTSQYTSKGHHTADDCIMRASGKGAEQVRGYLDNTDVYRIIKSVLP